MPDEIPYSPGQSKATVSIMIVPLVVRLLMVSTLLPDALPTYVLANVSELGVEEISVVCCAGAIEVSTNVSRIQMAKAGRMRRFRTSIESLQRIQECPSQGHPEPRFKAVFGQSREFWTDRNWPDTLRKACFAKLLRRVTSRRAKVGTQPWGVQPFWVRRPEVSIMKVPAHSRMVSVQQREKFYTGKSQPSSFIFRFVQC